MGLGIGMGYVAKGLLQGEDDVRRKDIQDEERQFRNEQRQYMREDRQYQQEERNYQRERRGILDARADDEYAYKKRHRDFADKMKKALGRYVATKGADYQPAVDLMNSEFNDSVQVRRNPDGTFSLMKDYGNGLQPVKGAEKLDFDTLGTMFYSVLDPGTYIKALAEAKAKASKPVVVSDGAALVSPTGKELYRNPKDDTDAGSALSEKEIANAAYKRAKSSWGTLGPNGIYNLDGQSAKYANMNEKLAVALYKKMKPQERDISAAHETAYKIVRAIKDRDEFQGEIPGKSSILSMNDDDANKAASFAAQYFPVGGTEQQIRAFLSKGGIDNERDQAKVVAKLRKSGLVTKTDPLGWLADVPLPQVDGRDTPAGQQQAPASAQAQQPPAAAQPQSPQPAARGLPPAGQQPASNPQIDRSMVIPDKPQQQIVAPGKLQLPPGETLDSIVAKAKEYVTKYPHAKDKAISKLREFGMTDEQIKAAGIL